MKTLRLTTGVTLRCMALMVLLVQSASAQGTNKIGTSAATFLRIPVGARAVGMGSSFVSMVDDASGLFWNPSALSSLNSRALMFDHSLWLPGINFDFVGFVLPLDVLGTVGVSATILHTDEMEVTTPAEQMGTGETFTASSLALGVSYSRPLTDRFSIGGTFKYIRETIYNSSAAGFAFDVGTVFATPFAGIRLGASISNFGTKMQIQGDDLNIRADIAPNQQGTNQSVVATLKTDEFDLPLTMRIGISGEVVKSDDLRLTLSADGVNPNDNARSVNLGGEVGLLGETIRLRAGYKDLFLDQNEFGLTFGLSLNKLRVIGGLTISTEYAYQQYVHLGNSNRFTLGIRF
jgi:hypothetical protein